MFVLALRAVVMGLTLASLYYFYNFNKSRGQERQHQSNVRGFDGSSHTTCLVCLNEFDSFSSEKILVLPCRHKYHEECISQVFRNEATSGRLCPLCRRPISDEFIENFLYGRRTY